MKLWKPVLWACFLAGVLTACSLHKLGRDDSPVAVSPVVKDTLWVVNLQEYEYNTCEVAISTPLREFRGREEVHQGRVWFDVRTLPPARYMLWIRVPGLVVTRWFEKI